MNGRIAKALRREVLGKNFKKRENNPYTQREPKIKEYKILKEIYKNLKTKDSY